MTNEAISCRETRGVGPEELWQLMQKTGFRRTGPCEGVLDNVHYVSMLVPELCSVSAQKQIIEDALGELSISRTKQKKYAIYRLVVAGFVISVAGVMLSGVPGMAWLKHVAVLGVVPFILAAAKALPHSLAGLFRR